LIAVFPGTYPEVPKDFNEVVDQIPQFSAFFPLQPTINRGFFAIVANLPVSTKNQPFPIFRSGPRDRDGRRASWWLWDGENAIRLDRPLTEEEKKHPTEGIISAPLLIERIEKGYRAEIDDIY
jgi:hypothetical protein